MSTCLILASCGHLTDTTDRRGALAAANVTPQARTIAEAEKPCADPVAIPPAPSDVQAGRLWRTDRDNLVDCGSKNRVLVGELHARAAN